MPHRHYCTYFDHRYMSVGLALHASLARTSDEFTLWVLALDHQAAEFLESLALRNVRVVHLEALEGFDPELKAVESTRSRVEYYFTCSPCLPRYLLATKGFDAITYLDSDLSFFSSPEVMFDELGQGSVLIVPHRFAGAATRTHARFGRYNVGWVTFRADAAGLACLEWWRARCLEWCFDRVEDNRYADQKYLDQFEALFPGVRSCSNPGANLAPWNVKGHLVEVDSGKVLVDGHSLVFFHFQGLRRVYGDTYDTNLTSYGARLVPALRYGVFHPYLADLRAAHCAIARAGGLHDAQSIRRANLHWLHLTGSRIWRILLARLAGNLIEDR